MAECEALRAKRKSYVAQMNLFFSYVDKLPETLSEEQSVVLEEFVLGARKLFDEINLLQPKIEFLLPLSELVKDEEQRNKFQIRYYEYVGKANFLTRSCQIAAARSSMTLPSVHANEREHSDMKLPPLNLPPFDGTTEKWFEFRDIFDSLIHNNISIAPIRKFFYLKGALRGNAASTIQSIETTAANYEVAYKTLIDRYNNKDLIIQEHLKSLFELNVCNRESGASLRNLIDSAQKHVRCLHAYGEPTDYWHTILVYLITSKLDNNTRRDWEVKRKTIEKVTFDDLTKFIKERWEVLEAMTAKSKPQNEFKSNYKFHAHLVSHQNCILCFRKEHGLYACPKFKAMSIRVRQLTLDGHKLCRNCMKSGHQTENCRSQGCKHTYMAQYIAA